MGAIGLTIPGVWLPELFELLRCHSGEPFSFAVLQMPGGKGGSAID